MLVIGFNNSKVVYKDLDVDPDIDSPNKIYSALKKATKTSVSTIVCVDGDEVVATFIDEEDFDSSDIEEDDDDLSEEDDDNPDKIFDNEEDLNEDD